MKYLQFIYRLIKNIASFLLVEIPLQIIGLLLLLIYLPFHRKNIRLNNYSDLKMNPLFSWFDNADIYVGRDSSTYLQICKQSFWTHYNWLTLRNPINYFQYKYLGFRFTGDEKYVIIGSSNINPLEVGDSTGRIAGFKQIELSNGYYEYLYVKRLGTTKCFYFRMGWKIGNFNNPPGSYCQKVFTVSYRSYSGV